MNRPLLTSLITAAAVAVFGALAWFLERGEEATAPVAPFRGAEEGPPTQGAPWDATLVTVGNSSTRSSAVESSEAAEPAILDGAADEPSTGGDGCALAVRVIDADNGSPLEGFGVVLEKASGDTEERRYTTGEQGRFETEPEWSVGLVVLGHSPNDRYPGDWRLEPRAVSLPEGVAHRGIEVTARLAAHVVTVEVVMPDGAPAVGARVMHVQSAPITEAAPGLEPIWRQWGSVLTDARGHAQVTLLREDAQRSALGLTLREPFEGHAADRTIIPPPLVTGPVRLELYAGGELEIRVVDERGDPVEGTEVFSYLDDRLRVHRGTPRMTGSGGVARYTGLAAGRHVARARFPGTDHWFAESAVEVERSARATVELVLPDESVPVIAAAGRVFDVDGNPLEREILLARIDDRPPERIFSRADGTFEYLTTQRGRRVRIRPGVSVFAAPYDPDEVSVDFGTTGLEFRPTEAMEVCVALFEIVDVRTGELLPDEKNPALVIYREPKPGTPVVAVAHFGLSGGVGEAEFLPHADLRYWVTAPGFGEARGQVELPADDGTPALHRVALQPGFDRALEVRDAVAGSPVAGARFVDNSGTSLGVTDKRGEVQLSAAEWPGELTIDCDGYAPLTWNPESYWTHHQRTLFLERR